MAQNENLQIPVFEDIWQAHQRIKAYIHRTPILTSQQLNRISDCNLFFKCENFQKVGAFKARGALSAVTILNEEAKSRGIATHSSGNHAQALAYAGSIFSIPTTVVMPETAPKIKVEAVRNYGATIIFCQPTLESRETTLQAFIEKTNATVIHPYDNYFVIAGQGTCAKEMFEDLNENGIFLDYLIAPVGGGGLISGTSIARNFLSPNTKVIGAEPLGADDAFRSLKDGIIYPSVEPKTIADGLLTSLSPRTFEIIRNNLEKIITVRDESIVKAMELIFERLKIVVEPSAAVSFAAVLENIDYFSGKNVGIILTGGNVDLEKLPWFLNF